MTSDWVTTNQNTHIAQYFEKYLEKPYTKFGGEARSRLFYKK